jgi:hypothetical protein
MVAKCYPKKHVDSALCWTETFIYISWMGAYGSTVEDDDLGTIAALTYSICHAIVVLA